MRSSLARYLIYKLVPIALAVNFVCNAIAAWLLFPAGKPVPLRGQGSLQADCAVAAFVITAITVLLTLPGARREAWAGRVRGFGWKRLRWPNRHPIFTAAALGLLAALAFTALAVRGFERAGVVAIPNTTYILFKALFASLVGGVTALLAALLGLGPEEAAPAGANRSVIPPRASATTYPLGYFDKGALAVTDSSRGCSGTPTWQLLVAGRLEPSQVRAALSDLVVRYPSIATQVQPLDGVAPWASRYHYVQSPEFQLDTIFKVVDVKGDPAGLEALCRAELNRPFDPFQDFPVTLTMAVAADESCRLLFRQHHMIADGRAFIGLLQDFAGFLEHARGGTRPPAAALLPIGRRGELEPLGLTTLQRWRLTAGGLSWLVRRLFRNSLTPLTPLLQNRSSDYSGEDGTVHWSLPESVLGRCRVVRKELGVSRNSLLTGALLEANARWHQREGQPVGPAVATLLAETRPRDGKFVSFANHLAMHEIRVDLSRLRGRTEAMRAVQREVESQRAARVPIQRLLAERALVLPLPLGDMRRFVFESARLGTNLYFSNLLALPFPTLEGAGWRVGEVRITTPVAPRTGIVVTVIHYSGRVVFNFNYKASAATRAQTRALAGQLEAVLAELLGGPLESTWC